MTKIGCTDWNHERGTRSPSTSSLRVAIGEEIERRAGLLVAAPEEHGGEEENDDRAHPFPLCWREAAFADAGGRPARGCLARRRAGCLFESR